MTIKEIEPRMKIIEYRQEPGDKDYGSCLWARFCFNLDRYEMSITSDCGNYGYKWCETPDSESFLHLMARCDKWYIINKIYGYEDIFDYELTKKRLLESCGGDEEDLEKLKDIFEYIEDIYGEPDTADSFVRVFEEEDIDKYFESYDIWQEIEYVFPANALKICEVFDEHIRPYIKTMLEGVI